MWMHVDVHHDAAFLTHIDMCCVNVTLVSIYVRFSTSDSKNSS